MKINLIKTLLFLFIILFAKNIFANPIPKITVALDGSGNFTSIQAAINSVPSKLESRTTIYIKNGLYNTEKLLIPENKKNITFIGESQEQTIISYHIYDCKGGLNNKCPAEDAAKWSGETIRTSATITIQGDGFKAENITFQNTAGPVGQALAISINSDKNIFINCSFLSYQDTIFLRKDGTRSYFKDCFVLGRTDYIYGGGIGYFDTCEIRSYGGGWITAPSTPKTQEYGFVFYKCKLTFKNNSPRPKDNSQLISLGRPWHNHPKVTWIKCDMVDKIEPLGWPTLWHMEYAPTSKDLHLYEYKNTGKSSDISKRANWVGIRELSKKEAKKYTMKNVIKRQDNWNPKQIK